MRTPWITNKAVPLVVLGISVAMASSGCSLYLGHNVAEERTPDDVRAWLRGKGIAIRDEEMSDRPGVFRQHVSYRYHVGPKVYEIQPNG